MNSARDRFAALVALRPATTVQHAWPDVDRDELLDRVLLRAHTTPDVAGSQSVAAHRRTAPTRRFVLVAAAVAVVAVTATTVLVSTLTRQKTYLATPELLRFTPVAGQQDPRTVLADLASRAQARPDQPGHGNYHYIHSKGWFLRASTESGDRVTSSSIAEIDRQLWLTQDGSGRLVRDAPQDSQAVLDPDMTLAPGYFDGRFLAADASQDAVRGKYGHANTAAGWAQTIAELWGRQVVPPRLQSRLLQVLAQQPGVTLCGETTDRQGRTGIAVSAETEQGPREQIVLVLHPETGDLLDAEFIILQETELPVHPPATISYTVVLTTGYTDNTTTQP